MYFIYKYPLLTWMFGREGHCCERTGDVRSLYRITANHEYWPRPGWKRWEATHCPQRYLDTLAYKLFNIHCIHLFSFCRMERISKSKMTITKRNQQLNWTIFMLEKLTLDHVTLSHSPVLFVITCVSTSSWRGEKPDKTAIWDQCLRQHIKTG